MSAQHDNTSLQKEIRQLATSKNAVILAHNYTIAPVQDVADYVGDSLQLARLAANSKADIILFCGVHFMAETAAILSPHRKVLLPDMQAGCSLAESITAAELRAWKAEHPGAVVVSYVNTSAEVKAETDICCTSSNAVQVVESIPAEKEVLFCPDMFLGSYVKRMTGRQNMHIWLGECHVHAAIRPADVEVACAAHPDAQLLIHPECGCVSHCLDALAAGLLPDVQTFVLSTSGMLKHASSSPASDFVVATETGILHPLRRDNPSKQFHPISPEMVCQYMKLITLEKTLRSLQEEVYHIVVPDDVAAKARLSVERMLAIG